MPSRPPPHFSVTAVYCHWKHMLMVSERIMFTRFLFDSCQKKCLPKFWQAPNALNSLNIFCREKKKKRPFRIYNFFLTSLCRAYFEHFHDKFSQCFITAALCIRAMQKQIQYTAHTHLMFCCHHKMANIGNIGNDIYLTSCWLLFSFWKGKKHFAAGFGMYQFHS